MTTRVAWVLAGLLGALSVGAALAVRAGAEPKLELAQILEKSAAARGGRDAWAKVQTMAWSGHVDRGEGAGPRPQFVLEQKRPNLTRFEIVVEGQRSVRVFDGQQGWKLRPDASGRPELQPYGEEERRAALEAPVIDGPALGIERSGVAPRLEGVDEVDGRPAYRLSARLPSGTVQHVWVDARSFLEVKYDRPARDAAGHPATVAVYLRNYRAFEGLQIPLAIETALPGGGPASDRLVIERVAINPNLPDEVFARPGLRPSRRGVTVDTRAAAGVPSAPPAAWPSPRAPSASSTGAIERRGATP